MPDQPNEQQPGSPAQPATQGEHMIPKSRFDEVNAERQALQAKIAALETEQKAETDKRLAEQNQWRELAEKRGAELADAQSKAAEVDEYKKTLDTLLEKEIANIPEAKRVLIPTYGTVKQRLDWIGANRAILAAPQPFDIGAGRPGGNGERHIELTPEEIAAAKRAGMTPEEYAKYK